VDRWRKIVDAFVKTEPQFVAIRERFSGESRATAA